MVCFRGAKSGAFSPIFPRLSICGMVSPLRLAYRFHCAVFLRFSRDALRRFSCVNLIRCWATSPKYDNCPILHVVENKNWKLPSNNLSWLDECMLNARWLPTLLCGTLRVSACLHGRLGIFSRCSVLFRICSIHSTFRAKYFQSDQPWPVVAYKGRFTKSMLNAFFQFWNTKHHSPNNSCHTLSSQTDTSHLRQAALREIASVVGIAQ